ncbi:alpha/beta hydrolase [Desertihabitans brevis]|uniref:alpha/beta hydrolase n=1 Tax=Desertihabitans brevis TaxID=2268447 RepID=UPI001F3FC9DD|nr:alpha/beta fold hydrolase [Desertihabitans brevis]
MRPSRQRRLSRATPAVVEPYPVRPEAAPFHADGDRVGVLLCHGFTGSPASMRPFAEHLARAGRTVALPRLPGHGTHWRDLAETTWTDWYAAVEQEFNVLRRSCGQVFLVGLSMGGALALRVAARYGADVSGLVLVNPAVNSTDRRLAALPLLRRVTSTVGAIGNDISKPGVDECGYPRTPLRALGSVLELWADVRGQLGRVHQPLLLLRSRTDRVVDPSSARIILAGVASSDVEEVVLEHSYHVATLDHDAPLVFARTEEFIAAHRRPERQEAV